jgi:hypothetical protein
MAFPTCVKCGFTTFQLQPYDPPEKMYKVELLCCTSCGAVVGTTGYLEGIARADYVYRAIQKILAALNIDPSSI